MSRIAVIGGHGKVALELARLLVRQGDPVTSVVRNPAHCADVEATGAACVVADVERLSTAELSDLIHGQDAVVWSAGAGGGDAQRTTAVDRDAAVRTIDAAVAAKVPRFVMVSYLGARLDHGVDPQDPFYAYAEAKAAADEHLRRSALSWTILGPGRLTDDPATGQVELERVPDGAHPTELGRGSVSRANVALVAAAALAQPQTIGQFLAFNDGNTPVSAAITSV